MVPSGFLEVAHSPLGEGEIEREIIRECILQAGDDSWILRNSFSLLIFKHLFNN